LIQFVVAGQQELGRRAVAYSDAIFELEDPPRDLVNEALVFTLKADDVVPNRLSQGNADVQDAWRDIHYTIQDLKAI
jgi:hypothetical protein